MALRKINAVTSLLSTLLLLIHAITLAIWMLSRGTIVINTGIMPWVLLGIMLAHAMISIDLAISAHSETNEKHKFKSYPKENIPTIIQRASGMALILFTALHVAGAAGFMQPPQIVHAIVPPLFFTIALMHTAISTNKAFITLGIGDAKFIKVLGIAMKVICITTLIADIIGFYLHVC